MLGIFLVVKDNILIKGIFIIVVFKMFYNYELIFDVMVVEKLYVKDMIVIGKVNMDEFVMGGFIEIFYFKKINNVWDYSKVLGGLLGGFVVVVVLG